MKYQLKAYSIWEYGKRVDAQGNPHQEDSLFPQHDQATADDRLFILCDGMGGHDAGEVASATVCEAMSQSILTSTDAEGDFSKADLDKAIADAFAALDAKDNGAEKKMGTTMTLLKLYQGGCYIAHMGDSRVYHIRPGKTVDDTRILFQTEDHSLVNDLIKIGELTPEEAKRSRQKNVITRAMQPHMERRSKADVYHTTDIQAGDYFYLCSDGMLENMESHQLCFYFTEAVGDGTDEWKVQALINATEDNRDNHSAFLIHILEVDQPVAGVLPIVKPVEDYSRLPKGLVEDSEDEVGNESVETTEADSPTETEQLTAFETEAPKRAEETKEVVKAEASEEEKKNTPTPPLSVKPKKELSSDLLKRILKYAIAFICLVLAVGIVYYFLCWWEEILNPPQPTEPQPVNTSPTPDTPSSTPPAPMPVLPPQSTNPPAAPNGTGGDPSDSQLPSMDEVATAVQGQANHDEAAVSTEQAAINVINNRIAP